MDKKELDTGGYAFGSSGNTTMLDYFAIEIGKARICHSGIPIGSDQEWWCECNYDLAQVMINEKRRREREKNFPGNA